MHLSKNKILLTFFVTLCKISAAQELYVSTEPASNMATGSIGFRLNSKVFKMSHTGKFDSYRIEPEVMFGASRKTMIHIAAYGSDMFQSKFRVEGASLYGKYRFFSQDEVHEHFRMAVYAKISFINNPQTLTTNTKNIFPDGNGGLIEHEQEVHLQNNEIDLDGNNSGLSTGLVATKLVNKLAISGTLGYVRRLDNINNKTEIFEPLNAITYTASAGYLLFPHEYTSYRQTNCNLYAEVLGQIFTGREQSYIDVAPAIQFIFNSISRMDVSYRTQIAGNVNRLSKHYFMVRLEYNLLNVFGKK